MCTEDNDPHREKATARLRTTLTLYQDGAIGLSSLERRLPASEIESWQALQQQTPGSDPVYTDLCCLLAYYGRDFETNIQRIYQPYRELQSAKSFVLRRRAEHIMEERLRSIPGHLTLLFERHDEPALLPLLLGLRFVLRTGRMAHHQAILRLWERRRVALLYAASLSAEYRRAVACALIVVCRAVHTEDAWQSIYSDLRRSVHSRDRRQMWTANRIIAPLKRARLHWRAWEL